MKHQEREWHLDLVRDEATLLLFVFEPQSARLERQEVARPTPQEIVSALRTVMLRTVPEFPEIIVTDNAMAWSGVAEMLGVRWQILRPTQPTIIERMARNLINNSMPGGAK